MLVRVTRVRVDHYLGWSREEGPGAGGDVTWEEKELLAAAQGPQTLTLLPVALGTIGQQQVHLAPLCLNRWIATLLLVPVSTFICSEE